MPIHAHVRRQSPSVSSRIAPRTLTALPERHLAKIFAVKAEQVISDEERVLTGVPQTKGVSPVVPSSRRQTASPSRMTLLAGSRAIAAPFVGKSLAQGPPSPLRKHPVMISSCNQLESGDEAKPQ